MDGTIALTIIGRIIQAGGGVSSLFFIAFFLTKDEQGYYYTFTSILAINVFFELGLSGIITQYVAHEFAHLKMKDNGQVEGEQYYVSRLSSLLHFCIKWFGIISIALFFILIAAGFYFFNEFNHNVVVEWQKPWIILCIATALNLFIDPLLAFFDGLGEVKDMAAVRLIQRVSFIIVLFVCFALGFKLYSSAIASLVSILINYIQIIFSRRRLVLEKIWAAKGEWLINYVQEIFPYQWRIALSWISGYFIFQLFNPVLFAVEGPVVAGQMGMTLQALTGVSALSMSWITTKIPLLSAYIAKKEYRELDTVFDLTVKQLAMINLLLMVVLLSFIYGLNYYNSSLSIRFLPLLPTFLLSLVTFVNQYIFSWATYLRCHKQEPFLVNSIVGGILCALSTILLGRYFGLTGIVYGYSFITVIIALPWSFLIFKSKKALWHTT
jgi:O-antigen/teichoic acid export membrane protein